MSSDGSNYSSHTSDVSNNWNEIKADITHLLADAQLETQQFVLQRFHNIIVDDVWKMELESQEKLRRENSTVNDLRVEINYLEQELNQVRDRRRAELLRLRQAIVKDIQDMENENSEAQVKINKLRKELFEIQHNHQVSHNMTSNMLSSESLELEEEIKKVAEELQNLQNTLFEVDAKYERKMAQAKLLEETMKYELEASCSRIVDYGKDIIKDRELLEDLETELFKAEEISKYTRERLEQVQLERTKIRSSIHGDLFHLYDTKGSKSVHNE